MKINKPTLMSQAPSGPAHLTWRSLLCYYFFGKKYAQIVKTNRASKAEAIASHPVVPLRVVARRVIEPAREMCGKMAFCRLFLFCSFVEMAGGGTR